MKLATILYERGDGEAADSLLSAFALSLRQAGFKLARAVQSNDPIANRSRCDITLEDLATGQRIKASNDRGPLAKGCRLDESALEDSVGLAASALGPETDLVVINRFGKREAEGHGFRSMIETAVCLGVPVLVALNSAHLRDWTAFVGEEPVLLRPELEAVSGWCGRVLGDRASRDGALRGQIGARP
jgi:nucleoside-triphosphatase THEP1